MSPPAHAVVSVAIGGATWAVTRSPGAVAVALLVGVLIDLDHLPDYYHTLVLGRRPRLWLVLHSYEGVVPGTLAAYLSGWNPLVIAGLAAFLAHILCDQVANPVRPLGYFFTYRALKGFRVEELSYVNARAMEGALVRDPLLGWLARWTLRTLRRLHGRRPAPGREEAPTL
ncbi:MAG: hypothetical protein HY683_02860 [Chloroflexi bacterium]|nr:hypothetical protein [Chloroflexota bacterium]